MSINKSEIKRLQNAYFAADYCSAQVGSERSFLALHDNCGGRFPLLCINSVTSDTVWQAEAWATGSEHLMMRSGAWHNEVEIVSNDQIVCIFGNAPGCYAEAFHVNSGLNLFRFCTGDWYYQASNQLCIGDMFTDPAAV